ncbi:MAG: methyltransferase domain-containing protein [Betaproteobacteria bacterium]|nr:methyltransferase domain-containing protein [Betaproteobacteria bacterium]
MTALMQCPQCRSDASFMFAARDLNRRRSDAQFSYFRCGNCGLIFMPDIPADLSAYYAEDYYQTLSLDELRKTACAERFKIDLIRSHAGGGRLLEIGPSRGAFAYLAREANYDVEVIEKDRRCCTFINDVLGIKAIASDDPAAVLPTLGKYDVIALWHVVEHLADPWKLLDLVAANLAHDGVLVIATPNPESLQFQVLGAAWPHVDAPRHTCLVPRQTLVERLQRHGLRLAATITNDLSARSANRFGWGAFLANRLSNRWLRRPAYLLGCAFSVPLMLVERRGRASAYTVVFRK